MQPRVPHPPGAGWGDGRPLLVYSPKALHLTASLRGRGVIFGQRGGGRLSAGCPLPFLLPERFRGEGGRRIPFFQGGGGNFPHSNYRLPISTPLFARCLPQKGSTGRAPLSAHQVRILSLRKVQLGGGGNLGGGGLFLRIVQPVT